METVTGPQLRRPRVWRYTVDEYDLMTRKGFFYRRRVELIEGRIFLMPPQYEPHVAGVTLAARAAERAFGPGYWARQQSPIRLGKRSKPEPDVAVVLGSPTEFIESGTPDNPLLIIEVSDTTLRYDRGRKAAMYAKFGVLDYWILNLVDRQLEVHRDPVPDPSHRFKFRYQSVTILSVDAFAAPLAASHAPIAIADMMPRQPLTAAPVPPFQGPLPRA